MKKRILIALFLTLTLISFSETDVDKNRKRINQIDTQIKNNNQKISTNTTKISSAKKSETQIKTEIASLNTLINKLQREYNQIEKEYVTLLKKIGKSEKEINESIRIINQSQNEIKQTNEEYNNKIIVWNKVVNSSIFRKDDNSAFSDKKNRDLATVLNVEESKVKNIEEYKSNIEDRKKQTEIIKKQTEEEAKKVEKKKKELESKRVELRNAKASKDKAVKQLQALQSKLSNENKTITSDNRKLLNEKKQLEAKINAILNAAKKKQAADNKAAQDAGKAVVIPKGTGKFSMPINGNIVVAYGQEKTQGLKSKGIEIRGTLGQSVKASDSGSVLYSGVLKGLGAVIMIDHGDFITVYGNLASVTVAAGAKVTKGQKIGTLGRDSVSKETNLYFEVRKGVNYVNPLNYL